MKILVVIPAFNEAENIRDVIRDLKEYFPEGKYLIINDGSIDETSSVSASLEARVINLPYNVGIGGAVQTGFIIAEKEGYDAVIQFDGDGQHMAQYIKKILAALDENTDIVIGSRFLEIEGYKMPFLRKFGAQIFSSIMSGLCRTGLTDTTAGFRAYGKRAIKLFSIYYPEDYPEVEALILARKKKLAIKEVAVQMRQRLKGKSSITPLRSIYYMIKVLLAVFVDLLKKY